MFLVLAKTLLAAYQSSVLKLRGVNSTSSLLVLATAARYRSRQGR
jgi:hypothetical protein